MMNEEFEVSLSSQAPRFCPVCGIRVAAKASECLMCGASLEEKEEDRPAHEAKRQLPAWIASVAAGILAVIILGGGGFGLYSMLASGPEVEPTKEPVTPTQTATPAPSSTPTATASPTSTPTPLPPRAHEVQEGETLSDIAERYEVAVEEILALNPEVDPELINLGQVLLVPAETPLLEAGGGGGDGPGSAGDGFVVHVVTSGETLSSIAVDYNSSVSAIRAANDLSPNDETIRAGQSLIVPLSTPTPSPSPTPKPDMTPTAVAFYRSPSLLNPPDGAVLTRDEPALIQWASVGLLEDDEWYQVFLRVEGNDVISRTAQTRATAWRAPVEFLSQGAANGPAKFFWTVQVVRETREGAFMDAGDVSTSRSFIWEASSSTPSPEATDTP